VQEYRKHMALVSQEPVRDSQRSVSILLTDGQTLYAGTVRFNILLGAIKPHKEVTQEEIEAACKDANILDFIRSLPECVLFFYHLHILTMTSFPVASILKSEAKAHSCRAVRSVGVTIGAVFVHPTDAISIERIAIARALLRNPKVLLLDEVRNLILVD
jgi:ABC-type multidrug transport system fused ATPase/permease subunit